MDKHLTYPYSSLPHLSYHAKRKVSNQNHSEEFSGPIFSLGGWLLDQQLDLIMLKNVFGLPSEVFKFEKNVILKNIAVYGNFSKCLF